MEKKPGKNGTISAVVCALLAAVFYGLNTPLSKLLLQQLSPTFMAAFLYLGAGLGVGTMYAFRFGKEEKTERLTRQDLPYTVGMIVLDILAPIFLMVGIRIGSAANASLLGNFEIVATALIALLVFGERISGKLWAAIGLITVSSIVLSFEGAGSFRFSMGSLFVLLAAACWGLENNCTRSISNKSTYQIVTLKGLFSGGGSFLIAVFLSEKLPGAKAILWAMLLGFVAYGLSIFLYIRAQRDLGAAKTSAYYAAAPFVGALLSFLIHGERMTGSFLAALVIMVSGTVLVVADTMENRHLHAHTHTIVHTHGGTTHRHQVTHSHGHVHFLGPARHMHRHGGFRYSREHRMLHGLDREA